MPVKVSGLRILFVYIDIDGAVILDRYIHKSFPQTATEIIRQNEKHLYLFVFQAFLLNETRYSQLPKLKGEKAYEMFERTKKDAQRRYTRLVKLSEE